MIPVLGYGDKPILGADYAQDWARCTTSSRERFFQKKKKTVRPPRNHAQNWVLLFKHVWTLIPISVYPHKHIHTFINTCLHAHIRTHLYTRKVEETTVVTRNYISEMEVILICNLSQKSDQYDLLCPFFFFRDFLYSR